jgi:dolichyl-diphosphooligosaccharide--protein glycosyltransferase
MDDVHEATTSLLDDRPEVADSLERLLALDEAGPWTFDETQLDSGTFGEIVSRGIAEETDEGYRLTDREAVAAAMRGDTVATDETKRQFPSLPTVDGRVAVAVAAVLALAAVIRTVPMLEAVFRGGDIVLAGNDPYFYRYWTETLLAGDRSVFSVGDLGELPGRVLDHDTLYLVVLWWLAALVGGDATAAGLVSAWFPVAAGVFTTWMVYLLGVEVSGDRRVGVAAALLVAVTPAHAFRTALGFGDHHAFDYVWLTVTAYAVAVLARDDQFRWRSSVRVGAVVGVAAAVAAQTAAWRGGPILLLPLGLFLVARAHVAVQQEQSPFRQNHAVVVGLAGGAVLTAVVHLVFGWLSFVRAFAPALLTLGVVVLMIGAEVVQTRNGSLRTMLTLDAVGAAAVVGGVVAGVPQFVRVAGELLAYFRETGQSSIAETASLFSGAVGTFLGPILLFGVALFIALPPMVQAVAAGRQSDGGGWLVVASYAWFFFLLATVQVRFAGQLALFAGVCAGVGFLQLAAWVDILPSVDVFGGQRVQRLQLPSRSTATSLALLLLVIGGLGVVQTGVKTSQVAVDEETYQTAMVVADHVDQEAPSDDYVFSNWGRNRVYNYFVSGDSKSYLFAQDNYVEFLSARAPSAITRLERRLDGRDTGYVVVTDVDGLTDDSVHSRLYDRHASRGDGVPGLGRFRLIHGGNDRKVFQFVRGARLTGSAAPNESVSFSADADVDDKTVSYRRTVETNRYGDYAVTVPYTGVYEFGDSEVSVSSESVVDGRIVTDYVAHYSFDEGDGNTTSDTVGRTDAQVVGATWVEGPVGSAVELDADEPDHVKLKAGSVEVSGRDSFTVCARARVGDTDHRGHVVHLGSYEVTLGWHNESGWTTGFWNESGERVGVAVNPEEPGEWQTVCSRYNGSEIQLWVDGEEVTDRPATGVVRDTNDRGAVGSEYTGSRVFFDGTVDDVRVYRNALNASEMAALADETADDVGDEA